ncbi:hypothetical protein Angca_005719, partial [Angiostrongylus cantonensis]
MADVQSTRFESDEEGRCTPSPVLKKKKLSPLQILKSDVMKGNETDYGFFVVDRTESICLDAEDVAEKGCFNCDGDHHFNECPEPKDMKRIRMRQNELRNKNNFSRYHDDAGSSEKKFHAGRISDELRNALGIGKHDIPEYIYRMRRMGFIDGYPPGHLKKAIEQDESSSTLQFHMLDDKQSSSEMVERPDSPPPKINADKMIYYCGFNQSYRELRDRENFRIPPFHEFVAYHQEYLNKTHAKKLEERRRKRTRKVKPAVKRRSGCQEEEEEEVVILDLPPPPPPPSLPSNGDEDGDDDDDDDNDINIEIIYCGSSKGSSIGVMMGTPVLTRRRVNDDGAEAEQDESTTPSLESFRKGVVPFEAREEPTPHKGFLRRIMNKIRK